MLPPLDTSEPLTPKEELFTSYYLGDARFNATKAVMVGYEGDRNVLGVIGSNLLKKVKIQATIREALNSAKMSSEEVLQRRRVRESEKT